MFQKFSHQLLNNMLTRKTLLLTIPVITAMTIAGCSDSDDVTDDVFGDVSEEISALDRENMTFFVTSESISDGGNLGGLAGADAHCTSLANAAGANATEWVAYLSTTGADGENAIDRIGVGPWLNARGVPVAEGPTDLLSDGSNLNGLTAITENGDTVQGRGDIPNRHDILTGTTLEGLASTDATGTTCSNWTSNASGVGAAIVGHHDRSGPLIDFVVNPNSFSSAHPSTGCSQEDLRGTGGDGLLYCFAPN